MIEMKYKKGCFKNKNKQMVKIVRIAAMPWGFVTIDFVGILQVFEVAYHQSNASFARDGI